MSMHPAGFFMKKAVPEHVRNGLFLGFDLDDLVFLQDLQHRTS